MFLDWGKPIPQVSTAYGIPAPLPVPPAPVAVNMPSAAIPIQFVGSAPGLIAGITQINAQLPAVVKSTNPRNIGVNLAGATFYVTP